MIVAALLLAGVLAAYARFLFGRRRRDRRAGHRFAMLVRRMLLLFGVPGLGCLLLLDRGGALIVMPAEFAGAQRLAADWTGLPAPAAWPVGPLLGAMLAGGVIAGLIARLRRRPPATLGRIDMLLPRSSADLGWALLLSGVAGVCEELFFRLVLPLLVALCGVGAVPGFALSAVLFGLAHRYQGMVGVVSTFVVALLLSAAYLLTGRLWTVMMLHAALDVTALVVRPVVAAQWRPTRRR